MPDSIALVLLIAGALGAGLIGGVFYAFSTFVMGALRRLPAEQGIAAMQSINVVVINPLFLGRFMGTALLCVAIAIDAAVDWSAGSSLRIAGSAAYTIGTFGITMVCNVPLNNALARATPDEEGQRLWSYYLRRWTLWNHVRTAAAVVALGCFLLSAGS